MKKNTNRKLTTNRKASRISEPMRQQIVNAMKWRKVNPYRLAKMVEGKMSAQTVYDYVAGRSDITGSRLWHLMVALEMGVVLKSKGANR